MSRRGYLITAGFALCLASGCFATPTPLAPNIGGSVGLPHRGVQTEAVELPEHGEGFERFRPNGPNHWGIPRLVHGIQSAAATVAQTCPGGAPLRVGDLAARDGGRIPGHQSHRSGRDVDFLFYAQTLTGISVPSPGFVRFGSDGLAPVDNAGNFVRLDVERNWALVKALTRTKETGVQLLLVSHLVEALLIDYALARGEPLELIWRAETMMIEPKDSLPHDDHFHMRVACAPEDLARGCAGGGPHWDWLWALPPDRPLPPDELALLALDPPHLSAPPLDTDVH